MFFILSGVSAYASKKSGRKKSKNSILLNTKNYHIFRNFITTILSFLTPLFNLKKINFKRRLVTKM